MAKPNYNYEKRQRELKKARKKEAKRLKKLALAENAKEGDTVEAATPDTPTPE